MRQPRRDIALAAEYAPHVDVVRTLEDASGRATGRVIGDVTESAFESVDETQRYRLAGFFEVVVDCIVDVPPGSLPGDDALHRHPGTYMRTQIVADSTPFAEAKNRSNLFASL